MLAVWHNQIGGHTFQIGSGADREFVKVSAPHPAINLPAEAERLRWARRYTTVPTVLSVNTEGPLHWLHTAGIPGDSAVAPRWIEIRRCRCAPSRLDCARCTIDCLSLTAPTAGRWPRGWPVSPIPGLSEHPAIDRLVVCHGDACAPNTLLDGNGNWCGHVDFGDLGVADRWADLAVASWSLEWNYGKGWNDAFFAAYGVTEDPERMAYYRRLWDSEE